MTGLSDKKSNYISRVVASVDELLATIATLEGLTQEGIALGWVAPLGGTAPVPLADPDFSGGNGYLTSQQFAAVMATLQALDQQLHSNNGQILSALYLARK
jgi:hypothetical protein